VRFSCVFAFFVVPLQRKVAWKSVKIMQKVAWKSVKIAQKVAWKSVVIRCELQLPAILCCKCQKKVVPLQAKSVC
jgi:hypothetical protein